MVGPDEADVPIITYLWSKAFPKHFLVPGEKIFREQIGLAERERK